MFGSKSGMLGRYDIGDEIGKNIYIYPVRIESIKSNSLDLRASRFAWSLTTKHSIYDETTKKIVIPANDTALIYTEEAIYVSEKIGGTYNSKVSLVSKGLSHISTTLDNQYLGLSVIAIHNNTQEVISINEHEQFVTLHFWYLSSPSVGGVKEHDNEPGQMTVLQGFPKKELEDFEKWCEDNNWCKNQKRLYTKMESSEDYKEFKKQYAIEQKKYTKRIVKGNVKTILAIVIIFGVLALAVAAPAYWIDFGTISTVWAKICEHVIYPILVPIAVTMITSVLIKSNKNT